MPTHAQPWTAFYVDATMIVPAALLLAYSVITGPSSFVIPRESWILAAVATVPLGQFLFGLIDYAGDAWLATVYAFGLATAIVVGARLQQTQPWRLPSALFASFAIAGLTSVVLMVLQWRQHAALGTLLLSLPVGSRLSANLGQPNQLATLLVWGLIALWWVRLRQHLHGLVVVVLAVLLLAGIAMTQSRAGAVEVLLLAGAAWLFRRQVRAHAYAVALIGLFAWFALAFATWPLVDAMARPGQVPTLAERLTNGTRMMHWSILVDAIVARPWFGWGWNQVVHAQLEFARLHPPTHEVIQYGHNLVLDLLLWNGIPIGALLGIGIAGWFWRQYHLATSPERVLLLLAIAVFTLHAQFELPHGYFVFLLPVGLMVGSLHVPTRGDASVVRGRGIVTLVSIATLLLTLTILRDYSLVSEEWMAQRFRAANIGKNDEEPRPKLIILSNMDALLVSLRSRPTPGMKETELEQLGRITRRYPSAGGLFRYAWALALNGRVSEATQTLELLCHVHAQAQCVAARQAWLAKTEQEYPPARRAWPENHPERLSAQPS